MMHKEFTKKVGELTFEDKKWNAPPWPNPKKRISEKTRDEIKNILLKNLKV